MNAPDSPTHGQLREELSAHLDAVRASTDLTGPAIARAGAIRRRRRTMAAAGATLGTLLVASPFVWWNLQGPEPAPVPATTATSPAPSTTSPTSTAIPTVSPTTSPAPSSPSSSPTPVAVPTGDADALALRVMVDPNAPVVARPELPYLLDATLHRGDTTTTFDATPPFGYQRLAGDRSLLIEHPPSGGDVASVIDANGELVAELPAGPGRYITGRTNEAGTLFVLYASTMQGSETTATLSVYDEVGAPLYEKRNIRSDVRIAGFVGKRIFLSNTTTGRSSVWDLEANSIESYTEGIIAAVHEGTGRAAIFPSSDFDEARCTTVADVTGAQPVAVTVTCGKFQPMEFSPDGRHLLGMAVPSDGMLQSPSRVIDVATGRALVAFEEDRPLDMESGFLPDGSVALNLILDPVDGIEQNALMRCTVEGECTKLTPNVAMPDFGTTIAPRYWIVRR